MNDRSTLDTIRRILLVRTDRLGDMLLTLPMARAIREASPDVRIGVLCRSYTAPIVQRCPDVDEVVELPADENIVAIAKLLRGDNWDAAFFPNARTDLAMAAWLAQIPIRVGTAYRWYGVLYNRRTKEHRKHAARHEAEFNLRMLDEIGIHADMASVARITLRGDEVQTIATWRARNNLTADFAVLHVGNGGSTQSWPINSWKSLAAQLPMPIVFTGSAPEAALIRDVMDDITQAGGRCMSFIGYSLPELAALLAQAKLVIAGSTGPGHLAATLGTQTIGLFPLPPALSRDRWGFRGQMAVNLAPQRSTNCPNCASCDCMTRISVEEVLTQAMRFV